MSERSEELVIRRVVAEDWRRLRDLRLRALAESPDAFASVFAAKRRDPDEHWREWAGAAARSPDTAIFIARVGGEWVGMCGAFFGEAERSVGSIFGMWTEPVHRRRGIGRRLLAVASDWARERGATALRLEVTATNAAARGHYAAAGFAETGNLRPLPSNPALSTIELRRALSPP